jgi:tetraprenyl-beta-curcumene synthase
MAVRGEAVTLGWAVATHRRSIVPRVRGEQRRWAERAAAISDPALREAALGALAEKSGNVEAVGVFALLAPRRHRPTVLRAIAALQVAVDYLDSLEEAGIDTSGGRGDGGYRESLEAESRQAAASLPSYARVAPFVEVAVERCKQGQRRTHAAARGGPDALRDWAGGLEAERARGPGAPPVYRWWEVAAGASSSVAAHALIAAAADQRTREADAEAIDAAYFPPIGALTVLLDDLVDRSADRAAGEHNYIDYHASAAEAAERISLLTRQAADAISPLPHARRHAAILAGVVAFYLGSTGALDEWAEPIRERTTERLGSTGRLAMAAVRIGRRA